MSDEELIADAKRWAAKIMPDGKPRAWPKFVPNVQGWYICPGNGVIIIGDLILDNAPYTEIGGYTKTEEDSWIALGNLLARLREELK